MPALRCGSFACEEIALKIRDAAEDRQISKHLEDAQGGDLCNSIEDGMPESKVREIIYRLLQALEYLQRIRI
jgi:hypothetical protein